MLHPFRLTTRLDSGLGMLTTVQGAVQWSWLSLGCIPGLDRELCAFLTMTWSPTLACLPGEPRPNCAFNAFRALSLSTGRLSSTSLTSTKAWCLSATTLASPPLDSAPSMLRVIVSIVTRLSKIRKGVKLAGDDGSGVTHWIPQAGST